MSTDEPHPLEKLYAIVAERRGADPATSYTARLQRKGRAKIAQKLGEEAVETVIEAIRDDREKLIEESADLLYHLVVLWQDAGVSPQAVWAALAARRMERDGKVPGAHGQEKDDI